MYTTPANYFEIVGEEEKKKMLLLKGNNGIVGEEQLHTTYYPTWFNGVVRGEEEEKNFKLKSKLYEQEKETVVIGGVSGRFEETENVDEFAQKLYGEKIINKKYFFNGEEEKKSVYGGEFVEFFGLPQRQWEEMHSGMKTLVKVTHEAIFDAGLTPAELRGTRTGVFIGTTGQQQQRFMNVIEPKFLASVFNFCGPVEIIDATLQCSSSLIALDAAVRAIRAGKCDYAIVAGLNFVNGGVVEHIKLDDDVKYFEHIGAIFVQKKETSRRFYADILHSRVFRNINNNGTEDYEFKQQKEAIKNIQTRLLKEIYAECEIDPSLVTYVENHGYPLHHSFNSIADFYGKQEKRTVPLFVGTTRTTSTTTTGVQQKCYQEETGIVALIKMLVAIQRGVIPANLEYQEPCQEVSTMLDGRMRICNTNTQFRGGLMALNAFGCPNGATNAHILLKPNSEYVMRQLGAQSFWNQDLTDISAMPRVFNFCARTQQGLEQIFEHIKRSPQDLATQFLLHPNSKSSLKTHPFRGFTVLNGEKQFHEIEKCNTELFGFEQQERPVWFIFNGVGSQYQGMGQEMMKIKTFRDSIKRSCEYLRLYDFNLLDVIYGKPIVESSLVQQQTNIQYLVGITAIQMALVDCLRQMGVQPEGMIGHSIGELACAYADNTLTYEETLAIAYLRAKCIRDEFFGIRRGEQQQEREGGMALVGWTWEECQQRLPYGLVPAIHNATGLVTISGAKKLVCEFVEELKRQSVYAEMIDSSDIAFHSHHMIQIAPLMRKALEKVIRSPKLRSSRWISTSIPEQRWGTDLARYSSIDYHINTLCSPVFFQESLKHIPRNAIVIELGPRSLLQEVILKELNSKHMCYVPLMVRPQMEKKQLEHFWTQVGRMYNQGINVEHVKLFVPSGFEHTIYPVPVNTKFLSLFAKLHSTPVVFEKVIGEKKFIKNEIAKEYYNEYLNKFVNTTYTNECKNKLPYEYQQQQEEQVEDEIRFGKYELLNNNKMIKTVCGEQEEEFTKLYKFIIDLNKETYLQCQQVEGRFVYPVTGYLHLVWQSFAKLQGCDKYERFPVNFEDVEFHREQYFQVKNKQVINKPFNFEVRINPINGRFQVWTISNGELIEEQPYLISTGRVQLVPAEYIKQINGGNTFNKWFTGVEQQQTNKWFAEETNKWFDEKEFRCQEEIYAELKKRGVEWTFAQPIIRRADLLGNRGELTWTGKWVPFLESMLHMSLLGQQKDFETITTTSSPVFWMPRRIKSFTIDPTYHFYHAQQQQQLPKYFQEYKWEQEQQQQQYYLPFFFTPSLNKMVCGGVQITGIHLITKPHQHQQQQWKKISQKLNPLECLLVEKQELINNTFVKQQQLNINSVQFRDFCEFYLSECKRYTNFILKKLEQQQQQQQRFNVVDELNTLIVPTPFGQIEQEYVKLNLKPVFGELIESGKLLQLLVRAVNVFEQSPSCAELCVQKVHKLFNEKNAYLRAVEEDLILSHVNTRFGYLKCVLESIVSATQQSLLRRPIVVVNNNNNTINKTSRDLESLIIDSVICNKQYQQRPSLVKRVNVTLTTGLPTSHSDNYIAVHDMIAATDKLTTDVLERGSKRVQDNIELGKRLMGLMKQKMVIDKLNKCVEEEQYQQYQQQQQRCSLPVFIGEEEEEKKQYQQKQQEKRSVLHYVARILGLRDESLLLGWLGQRQVTLEQLGFHEIAKCVELKQVLESRFRVNYTIEQIKKLSVDELELIGQRQPQQQVYFNGQF